MNDARDRIRCGGCRRRFLASRWVWTDYCWRCYYEVDRAASPSDLMAFHRLVVMHMEEAARWEMRSQLDNSDASPLRAFLGAVLNRSVQ